jgi:hypothetical protein
MSLIYSMLMCVDLPQVMACRQPPIHRPWALNFICAHWPLPFTTTSAVSNGLDSF